MTNEEKMAKAVAQRVEGITTRVAGERYTKFLEMYLPGENNYYRVEEDQNQNFEKIDGALENAQRMAIDLFSKKQEKEDNNLTTNDKTVVGAINESKAYTDGLAGLQGENSFPLSRATEGQVYKEPNSKKYYVCIKNYSGVEISVPNGNFEILSVWKNRERTSEIIEVNGYKHGTVIKFEKTYIDSDEAFVRFQTPFKNECTGVIPVDVAAEQDGILFTVVDSKTTKEGFYIKTNKIAYSIQYLAIGR